MNNPWQHEPRAAQRKYVGFANLLVLNQEHKLPAPSMAPDALLQAETSISSLPLIERLTELRADERALRRELMERSICLPVADLVDPNQLSQLHQNIDQLSTYLMALLERDKQLLLRLEQHCSLAATAAPVPNDTLFVEPEHQRAFADGCLQMAQFLGSKMHRIDAQLQWTMDLQSHIASLSSLLPELPAARSHFFRAADAVNRAHSSMQTLLQFVLSQE